MNIASPSSISFVSFNLPSLQELRDPTPEHHNLISTSFNLMSNLNFNFILSHYCNTRINLLGLFPNITRIISYYLLSHPATVISIPTSNEQILLNALPPSYVSSYHAIASDSGILRTSYLLPCVSFTISATDTIFINIYDEPTKAFHTYALHHALLYSIAYISNSAKTPVPEPPPPSSPVSHHVNFIIDSLAFALCFPPPWNASSTYATINLRETHLYSDSADYSSRIEQAKHIPIVLDSIFLKINPFHQLHAQNKCKTIPYHLTVRSYDRCPTGLHRRTDVLRYTLTFDTTFFISMLQTRRPRCIKPPITHEPFDQRIQPLWIPPLPLEVFTKIILEFLLLPLTFRSLTSTEQFVIFDELNHLFMSDLTSANCTSDPSHLLQCNVIYMSTKPFSTGNVTSTLRYTSSSMWPTHSIPYPMHYAPKLHPLPPFDTPRYHTILPPICQLDPQVAKSITG
jgi:hypothetical protein